MKEVSAECWSEEEYNECLLHERHMYAWCLIRYSGMSVQEAQARAETFYQYQAPGTPYRGLLFHDEAWHWAMLKVFGDGYWQNKPDYAKPTKEYEEVSSACFASLTPEARPLANPTNPDLSLPLLETMKPTTCEEALSRFGLPASVHFRDELRTLLDEAIENVRQGEGDTELLRVFCLQVFSLGVVEDSILIWKAKKSSFDSDCGLDVQFLCGAGLEATKDYLAKADLPFAPAILEYLSHCEKSGDFQDWTPGKTIADYRRYFRLE